MKKLVFALAFLATSFTASAGNFGIQLHTNSWVFADRKGQDWVEATPGIAVVYRFDDVYSVQAGHYRNEQSTNALPLSTNYVYGDWTPVKRGLFSLGVYAGLVSGYNDFRVDSKTTTTTTPGREHSPPTTTSTTTSNVVEKDNGINPVAGLVMRVDYKKFNVTARLHPDFMYGGPATLAAEVGYTF